MYKYAVWALPNAIGPTCIYAGLIVPNAPLVGLLVFGGLLTLLALIGDIYLFRIRGTT